MTDAPPTPALDLVVEALREFGIKCASELNVTGTVLRFADERAEPAARALLQKLAQTNDAVYQRGYAEGCRHEAAEFKNFHRSLCERFGYTHDERDWKRDQVSLEEHIAKRLAPPDAIRAAEPKIYTKADAEALCAIAVAAATSGTYESNCERIEKRLMEHRLSYTHGDDGDAYPLVDRLVPDGETTIETGRKEIELLAENIADLFGKPAPPSGAALWGEVTPEGDDAFTDFCTRVWDVPENAPVLGLTVKELRRIYDLARDASPAQGWKLVPVEPTPEMWEAGMNCWSPDDSQGDYLEKAYAAMLNAAPPPPAGEGA